MSNFFDALELVEKPKPVKYEYRLYYDADTGKPLYYSMADDEGDYIIVTKEQFAECRYDVIVKDGKLEKVRSISIGKLAPSDKGYGTRADDISIVGNDMYWSSKTYE